MQQTKQLNTNTTMQYYSENKGRLRHKKVKDMMVNKRRLVEVPHTATIAHSMNALVANQVMAVPVAAPPGHWIGAGGSMIMEADKQTGVVRKHYIGIITMLDILAHIAGNDDATGDVSDLDRRMAVEVSSVIGHCLESLSLWTLNPNTSILECMEVLSKGIHRALIPLDGQLETISGSVELEETASSYRMLTQMDLLKFIKQHHDSDLDNILSTKIKVLGAITENVFAITEHTKVIEAIKSMRKASLNALPIVSSTSSDNSQKDHTQLINGKGRKLRGTFSATDLRGSHLSTLESWLPLSALEFTESVWGSPILAGPINNVERPFSRELVTCQAESSLAQVIEKVVDKHVHRVWVVDSQGLLVGLVSLTDVIRVLRLSLLSTSTENIV